MNEKEAKRNFKKMVKKYGKKYHVQLIKHFPSGEWSVRKLKKVI
jgi:hypothetical protein